MLSGNRSVSGEYNIVVQQIREIMNSIMAVVSRDSQGTWRCVPGNWSGATSKRTNVCTALRIELVCPRVHQLLLWCQHEILTSRVRCELTGRWNHNQRSSTSRPRSIFTIGVAQSLICEVTGSVEGASDQGDAS